MPRVGAKSGTDGEQQGPSCRSSTVPVSWAWRPTLLDEPSPGSAMPASNPQSHPSTRSTTPRRCNRLSISI
jgi:hypothetical protein